MIGGDILYVYDDTEEMFVSVDMGAQRCDRPTGTTGTGAKTIETDLTIHSAVEFDSKRWLGSTETC